MSAHMVIFRSNEGKTGFHQSETLDEAVRFVEHLRNQEQVSDARVFKLEEVPLEVKTYFKVEVSTGHPSPAGPSPSEPSEPAPMATDPMTGEPMQPGVGAAANRFGLFNRA